MASYYGSGYKTGDLASEQYKNKNPYGNVYNDPKYQALVAAERMPTGGQGPGWAAPQGVTTLEQLQSNPDAYNSWVSALSNVNHMTPGQQTAASRGGGVAGGTPSSAPWDIQNKAYQDARAWGVSNGILPASDKWSFADFAPLLMFAGPAYAAMAGAAGAAGAGAGMGASPGAGTTFGASGAAAPTSSSAFGGMGTGTMGTAGGFGAGTNPALSGGMSSLGTGVTQSPYLAGAIQSGGMSIAPSGLLGNIPAAAGGAAGAGASSMFGDMIPGRYDAGGFGGNTAMGGARDVAFNGSLAGDIPAYTHAQNLAAAQQGGFSSVAGGAGASSLGGITMQNLAQFAKDWGPVVWAGMEYMNAKDAADAYAENLNKQMQAADPFGPERAKYQKMLDEHMKNPMSFLSSPQVQFASDAAARKMASMGYNMSGNQAQAIADASMGEYWKQAEMLSGLSGSGISPNAGAIQSGVMQNVQSRMGEQAALGNLGRSVFDAASLDVGQRKGEGGGASGGYSNVGERAFGFLDNLKLV